MYTICKIIFWDVHKKKQHLHTMSLPFSLGYINFTVIPGNRILGAGQSFLFLTSSSLAFDVLLWTGLGLIGNVHFTKLFSVSSYVPALIFFVCLFNSCKVHRNFFV